MLQPPPRTVQAAISMTPAMTMRRIRSSSGEIAVAQIGEWSHSADHKYNLMASPIVGAVVRVWWEGERRTFDGTITAIDTDSGIVSVVYDDGDEEELALEDLIDPNCSQCVVVERATVPVAWVHTVSGVWGYSQTARSGCCLKIRAGRRTRAKKL